MVEAVPPTALRALAVALQVRGTVVGGDVVLARYVEDTPRLELLQHLVRRIELLGLRELCDVARVKDERGTLRKRVHFGDSFLQRRRDILVRLLREADV